MRRNLVIITSFILGVSFFGLLGCDNGRNITKICKNNPEICADLHKDSWCLKEKTDLIQQRYQLINVDTPTGKQLYTELTNLEDYSRCIELAAGVQHIINTYRTEDRARAFRLSTQNLAKRQEESRDKQDPFMSYYQWTRFNDMPALQRLLAQEKAHQVTDPFLLAQIATYYSSIDALKAQQLYFAVFDTIKYDDFDPNWLLGLAATFRHQQQLDKTYMLTKANLLVTGQKYSADKMLALLSGNKSLQVTLDAKAQSLIDALQSSGYATSEVKHWLEPDIRQNSNAAAAPTITETPTTEAIPTAPPSANVKH